MTKCSKCENTTFELQEIEPRGSRVKVNAIQCINCKTPIGLIDYHNLYSAITKIGRSVREIDRKINNLNDNVQRLKRK